MTKKNALVLTLFLFVGHAIALEVETTHYGGTISTSKFISKKAFARVTKYSDDSQPYIEIRYKINDESAFTPYSPIFGDTIQYNHGGDVVLISNTTSDRKQNYSFYGERMSTLELAIKGYMDWL